MCVKCIICNMSTLFIDRPPNGGWYRSCLSRRSEQLHEPLAFCGKCFGRFLLNIGEGSLGELGTVDVCSLVSAPRVYVELPISSIPSQLCLTYLGDTGLDNGLE